MMNSNQKGKRGEREWRDELRAQGYLKARRGQQFAGSPDSPDVVCPELEQFHFEVKRTESLNVYKAYEQAVRDSIGTPIVAHKRNNRPWLVIMSAEAFFGLIRKQPMLENSKLQKPCGCEFGVTTCPECNPDFFEKIQSALK